MTDLDSLKETYEALWVHLDGIDPTESREGARRAAQLERAFRSLERELRRADPAWLNAYQAQVGL